MTLAITDTVAQTAKDVAIIRASLPQTPTTAQMARVLRLTEEYTERLMVILERAGVCSEVMGRWCAV